MPSVRILRVNETSELLSKLPQSVAYTCTKCTERLPAEWRTALERELQGCIRNVLNALLNSRTSTHLLRYRQRPVAFTVMLVFLSSVCQVEFSDDVVRIIQTAINSDGGQPESRKANSMVKTFFVRDCGRLLYIGQNEWAHVNCALWSAEVFEDDDGTLKNVHTAVLRGRQTLNRQRSVTSPLQNLSRPLTSPPPLIPSPARDPEKSKHVIKDSKKNPVQRDGDRGRAFNTDGNRLQSAREQGLTDADKGRTSSRDQASKESEKSRSPREHVQIDLDKGDISAKEPEKRRVLGSDSGLKESETARPLSRDSSRDSEKGRHANRDSSNRETDKSKTSSKNPNCKGTDKSRSLSRDAGQRDSEKYRQHSREAGKDLGQEKDRPSSRDSDKGRPSSKDSSYRSAERNRDSGSGKDSNAGSQSKRSGSESKSPRLAPVGSGHSSPPVGTAALSGQQRSGGTKQVEKHVKHGSKDHEGLSLFSRHRPNPPSNILQSSDKPSSGKESNSATGNITASPLHKQSVVGKSGSPQKSSTLKSNDYSSGLAGKSLFSSRTSVEDDVGKRISLHLTSPAAGLAAKDKHRKVKSTGSRDASKDRDKEKTHQNSSSNKAPLLNNNAKTTGSSNTHAPNSSSYNSKTPVLGNSTKAQGKLQGEKQLNQGEERLSAKSRDNYPCPERKYSSNPESFQQLQQITSAPEKGEVSSTQSHTKQTTNQLSISYREKKRPVKPSSHTPLKTEIKSDPNGRQLCSPTSTSSTVSPAGQGTHRSAPSPLFTSPSASSSDSSESDTQIQTEEDDLRKNRPRHRLRDHHSLLSQCAEEDLGEGPEDDHDRGVEDKHHEDDSDGSGSAKRRYPRRSARARSNMFFGLTPFYGVRSYGEEDIPFYGSGDGAGAVVKRRTSGRKKSAEGQVDGADDMSTSSSSADSGEDEDGGMKNRGKDSYYYNFTRTIINPGDGLPPIEGLDNCLGRGSHLQRFLKDEEQQQQRAQGKTEEDMLSTLLVH
ncbi:hypothetical protein XENOCAPTIV_009939, partial [Xenoophorus captivus]